MEEKIALSSIIHSCRSARHLSVQQAIPLHLFRNRNKGIHIIPQRMVFLFVSFVYR